MHLSITFKTGIIKVPMPTFIDKNNNRVPKTLKPNEINKYLAKNHPDKLDEWKKSREVRAKQWAVIDQHCRKS